MFGHCFLRRRVSSNWWVARESDVFLVTHDEDLIDEVATRIWHFEGDHQLTDFKGAYEEYQSVAV